MAAARPDTACRLAGAPVRSIFILVPSDSPAGPVKGAYALANALVEQRKVTLVALKRGPGAQTRLDPQVHRLCLADKARSLLGRVHAYRALLRAAGGRDRVASISMCLSADVVNAMCIGDAITCASVRGNLLINYRHDYGAVGIPLAIAHLFTLRWHNYIVAMNKPMAVQVRRYSGRTPTVIGNFVDESSLETSRKTKKRSGPFRFVFIGSLTSRKQPLLLLQALRILSQRGVSARLEYIGTGPLYEKIHSEVERYGLVQQVVLHGFINKPADLLSEADVMVLPSLSEGISRAALEALFLGIPCVLRNADGNSELVSEGYSGALFDRDEDLPDAMLRGTEVSRRNTTVREPLLSETFRQATVAESYLRLLEGVDAS